MKRFPFYVIFLVIILNACDVVTQAEIDEAQKSATILPPISNINQQCQKEYDNLIKKAENLILNDQNSFEEKKRAKKILFDAKEKFITCNLSSGSKAIKINDYCVEQAKSAKTIYENTKDNDFSIQYKFYTELSNLISNVDNK